VKEASPQSPPSALRGKQLHNDFTLKEKSMYRVDVQEHAKHVLSRSLLLVLTVATLTVIQGNFKAMDLGITVSEQAIWTKNVGIWNSVLTVHFREESGPAGAAIGNGDIFLVYNKSTTRGNKPLLEDEYQSMIENAEKSGSITLLVDKLVPDRQDETEQQEAAFQREGTERKGADECFEVFEYRLNAKPDTEGETCLGRFGFTVDNQKSPMPTREKWDRE
jgi:hypothetical protein